MKIKVVKITDINEKSLPYLVIENTKGTKINIHIGEKTYARLETIIQEETQTHTQETIEQKTTTKTK